MVEKQVDMEDNLMGSEDYKSVVWFSHKEDRHFFHKEDKVVVVLEYVFPQGIVDFTENECAKDLVSHSVHTTGQGLQSEITPQDEIVSPFEFDSQMEVSPQCEVECPEGSGNQK